MLYILVYIYIDAFLHPPVTVSQTHTLLSQKTYQNTKMQEERKIDRKKTPSLCNNIISNYNVIIITSLSFIHSKMLFRNAFHIFPFSNIHFISVPPYVPLYFALCCAAVATLLHSISPIKLMWSIVIKLHLVSLLIAHFTLFVWFGVSVYVCVRSCDFIQHIYILWHVFS